jgi:hypothetical protein
MRGGQQIDRLVRERSDTCQPLTNSLFELRGFPPTPTSLSHSLTLEPYVRDVGSTRYRVILHLATAVRRPVRTCLVARVCTTTCPI